MEVRERKKEKERRKEKRKRSYVDKINTTCAYRSGL